MKHHQRDALWVFWWTNAKPHPYPCAITAYRKRDCIRKVEQEIGLKWPKVYREGGRVVRCGIVPATPKDPT